MRFTPTGNTAGDCSTPYSVTEYESRTVGEFINEVLESRPNEWGEFSIIEDSYFIRHSCEYKSGRLLGEFQKSVLKKEIECVNASGGWSNMDYRITVKKKKK